MDGRDSWLADAMATRILMAVVAAATVIATPGCWRDVAGLGFPDGGSRVLASVLKA